MERKPLDKSTSPWVEITSPIIGDVLTRAYRRKVKDGDLNVIVGKELQGWHLSISHYSRKDAKRYPSWDEVAEARYSLLPDNMVFAMLLPAIQHYVSIHDTTFHLYQIELPGPNL